MAGLVLRVVLVLSLASLPLGMVVGTFLGAFDDEGSP